MSETIKKILNAIDKTAKPASSILAVVLDEHRIGWIGRIPRELKGAIEAIEDLFKGEE